MRLDGKTAMITGGVSGIGGFCQRNVFSANAAEPRRRYRAR